MRRAISNIADSYGLHSLHREYSKKNHFRYVQDEILELTSDFNKFYNKPILPKIHFEKNKVNNKYEKGELKFLSQVDNDFSNKYAIFHYIKSKVEDNNINIIFIHGWRAKDLNRLEKVFLNSFIERKYNVYRYVLPFHMERTPKESLYSGEYFISGDVTRTLKSVKQSVSDIRALISYIRAVEKGKIIIIGLSLGGLIANLLSEIEKNIDLLISLFYANNLAFTVFETEPGKYIKKDYEKNKFSYNKLSRSWEIINPCLRKPILDLDKILLVSGTYDKYVLNKDTDKLWEKWGKPKRHIYSCGHSGIVLSKSKIRKDILKFIDKRV